MRKEANKLRSKDIFFMPLGGGQQVGASCYFLRLGETNILLDAGIGKEGDLSFMPDEYALTTLPFIQSMGQIHQIYISHAHMDHLGYLFPLMKECKNAEVFMTEETATLAEYQLCDKQFLGENPLQNDESACLAAKSLLDQTRKVSFMQKIDFGPFQVQFFPAGHIPGAMMILFEFAGKKILYTGDFSVNKTALTDGCILPKSICVDVMILCALHAKHPWYQKSCNQLEKAVQKALYIARDSPIWCYVPQLSKGIEFLKCLNQKNTRKIPVYLDWSILHMVKKMEELGVPILTPENKMAVQSSYKDRGIYLTADPSKMPDNQFCKMKVDFSLHESFAEMEQLIEKVNPKQVVAVHCAPEKAPNDGTIEQVMIRKASSRTQFVFAENGSIYKI